MADLPSDEARALRRSLWWVLLLAAAVLVPRSVLIARAHSESSDDEYHMVRGLAFLGRNLEAVDLGATTLVNDPPLGEGILALPLWADNLARGLPPDTFRPVDHPWGPEFLLGMVAAWKALLFVPLVGVVFLWASGLYGTRAGWLAALLVLVEPTVAAHVPIPALDALGAEAIVVAAWLAWRAFAVPSRARLVAAGAGLAVAMAIKHTALVLPPIVLGYAVLQWWIRPALDGRGLADLPARLRGQARSIGWVAASFALSLWAATLFDVSPKSLEGLWTTIHRPAEARPAPGAVDAAGRPLHAVAAWPAGSYFRSLKQGMVHNRRGHPGYLLGAKRRDGWWYYFPVVATVKVPLGLLALLALAGASAAWARPGWREWGPAVPAAACLALALRTQINIGFRHFLPAYLFLLMLAARVVVAAGPRLRAGVAALAAAAAVQGLMVHPDELSFTNGLWRRPHLVVSDSNVDWGQGLKQVRAWYDARPRDGRPVRLGYFGNGQTPPRYLGDRPIEILWERMEMPRDGLLIASPVLEAGPYDPAGHFQALRDAEPVAVLGHALRVYDLDRLQRKAR